MKANERQARHAGAPSWQVRTFHIPRCSTLQLARALWDAHPTALVFGGREPPYPAGSLVVGLSPDVEWVLRDGKAGLRGTGVGEEPTASDALDSLREAVARFAVQPPAGFPDSVGGFLGYLGYDFVRVARPLAEARAADPFGFPDAHLVRPTRFVILSDSRHGVDVRVAALASQVQGGSDAAAAMESSLLGLAEARRTRAEGVPLGGRESSIVPSLGRDRYKLKFGAAQAMIEAGRAAQIGIAQRFELDFEHHALDLLDELNTTNPSPLAFALRISDWEFVGTSPRVLARLEPNAIFTMPIGGTRRRPADRSEDESTAELLLKDEKEVREHLMLFDSWVTDLSAVVADGVVEVLEKMRPEFFSHVIHLGSRLRGRPAAGVGPVDVLRAVFPAPTVVGAPKASALALLDELEDERRGLYGGCVGYIGAGQHMEMHIAIRTAVIRDGKLHVQAGAGIVAESDVDYEYREMESKAAAVLAAVRALDARRSHAVASRADGSVGAAPGK